MSLRNDLHDLSPMFNRQCKSRTGTKNPTNINFQQLTTSTPKTNMWENNNLKMYLLLKFMIFLCHVSLLEGTSCLQSQNHVNVPCWIMSLAAQQKVSWKSQDRHISQQNVEIQEVRASKSMIQVMGGVAGGLFFTWNIQACIIYWWCLCIPHMMHI